MTIYTGPWFLTNEERAERLSRKDDFFVGDTYPIYEYSDVVTRRRYVMFANLLDDTPNRSISTSTTNDDGWIYFVDHITGEELQVKVR